LEHGRLKKRPLYQAQELAKDDFEKQRSEKEFRKTARDPCFPLVSQQWPAGGEVGRARFPAWTDTEKS